MREVNPELKHLANVMAVYDDEVNRLNIEQAKLDGEIGMLQARKEETAERLGAMAARRSREVTSWNEHLESLHADPFYPYVRHGNRWSGYVSDYEIVGKGLLTRLREEVAALEDYTDTIDEPEIMFAINERSIDIGAVAPVTELEVDESLMKLPMEAGVSIFTEYSVGETQGTPINKLELPSGLIVGGTQGLTGVLQYGKDVISKWQKWLLSQKRSDIIQIWADVRNQVLGISPALAPTVEVADAWKEKLQKSFFNANYYFRTGDGAKLVSAAIKIPELRYTEDEIEVYRRWGLAVALVEDSQV